MDLPKVLLNCQWCFLKEAALKRMTKERMISPLPGAHEAIYKKNN